MNYRQVPIVQRQPECNSNIIVLYQCKDQDVSFKALLCHPWGYPATRDSERMLQKVDCTGQDCEGWEGVRDSGEEVG